jgi:DNA-binding NarL/FixJ family response regulator
MRTSKYPGKTIDESTGQIVWKHGMSLGEIAATLQIEVGTVRVILSSTMRKLASNERMRKLYIGEL